MKEDKTMLEKTMKELGLRFCGRWEDVAGYVFIINNPKMVSNGASFTVFDTNKTTLIDAMNDTEEKWIKHNIKMKKEVDIYV